MSQSPPLGLLACPKCRSPLVGEGHEWLCAPCAVEYPAVSKVPWLYRDPIAKMTEWQHHLRVAVSDFRKLEERLKAASRSEGLSALATKRLQRDLQARVEQRKAYEQLLAPLADMEVEPVELMRVLAGKSASTQMLTSYSVNAVRDWGWDETEENKLAFEICRGALGGKTFKKAVILGSGAGRLAYDLHQAGVADITVALDINPFLTLVAERMFSGKSFVMQEFPIAPDGAQNVALARKLSAPAKARGGLQLLFGDVLDAPLAAGAFDLVVTPWLIDILPEGPDRFAKRVNALLSPGGTWLNHGSAAFRQGPPERQVSREELLEIVNAAGFEIDATRTDKIPYLSSPASCQSRFEIVTTFAAAKTRACDPAPRHEALPSWLTNTSLPLPRPPALAQHHAMHLYHAEVMSLIDGKRSVTDVNATLAAKFGLNAKDAGPALVAFLATVYESL